MGLCFAKRSLEGWGSEEKKIFFGNFVSPEAKGWCHEGKSIEFGFTNEECVFLQESPLSFFFSHSNFVLRSRKKTQWTFLQDNIILLQDNIFILRS